MKVSVAVWPHLALRALVMPCRSDLDCWDGELVFRVFRSCIGFLMAIGSESVILDDVLLGEAFICDLEGSSPPGLVKWRQ